jgi:catechol 2,3-dioxygenase-like lactoylglutathione lyase family enzyme
MRIESINAVTLAVHDMSRSVRFYTALGFSVRYGGERAAFTMPTRRLRLSQSDCAARRSPLVMVGAGDPLPGAAAGWWTRKGSS